MVSLASTSKVRVLRRPTTGQDHSGRRLKAEWHATLRGSDLSRPCVVSNISTSGAHLVIDNWPEGHTDVVLEIKGFPPVPASTVWRKRAHIGLAFAAEQTWVSERCRARFDAAAWIKNHVSVPQ